MQSAQEAAELGEQHDERYGARHEDEAKRKESSWGPIRLFAGDAFFIVLRHDDLRPSNGYSPAASLSIVAIEPAHRPPSPAPAATRLAGLGSGGQRGQVDKAGRVDNAVQVDKAARVAIARCLQ